MNSKELPSEYTQFFELFNRGEYFEAHEVLEILWRKEEGPWKDFFRGLIQIAAVYVHLGKENRNGALMLYQKACINLNAYPPIYMGLNLEKILEAVSDSINQGAKKCSIKLAPGEMCA